MANELLFILTLTTNFLCMAITMWFAIYLLARSSANPLTFRAVVALLALAFFYINAFAELVSNNFRTSQVRALSVLIVLIATHDLTHYMLPSPLRRKFYWIARAIVLLGVIAIVLLFSPGPTNPCDPRFLCPAELSFPWSIINFLDILFAAAILFNLWLIRKSEDRLQNVSISIAVLLGISTVAISLVGTVLHFNLPRFIPNILILAALLSLLYSAARDRNFITRQFSNYEIPVSLVTIAAIVGIYVWSALLLQLAPMEILLLAVLAIFTHSSYDLVREFLARLIRKQEHQMRQELRSLAREADPERALNRFLHRGLAILCHNLRAHGGWIALCDGDTCTVMASLHSLPVGSQFLRQELRKDHDSQSVGTLMGQRFSLVPAFVSQEEVAIIALRAQHEKLPFSQEDLYWLEEIADEIGWMIDTRRKWQAARAETSIGSTGETPTEPEAVIDTGELLSKLAYPLDSQLVRAVEEGFRNLNDYSRLGKTSLASVLGIQAQDHIAAGKQVQQKLIEMIGELRPPGEPPPEPLPRAWYAYTILHGAYVEEMLARDIMGKLYISEGTYFRLRRQALRGIARALLETGAVV